MNIRDKAIVELNGKPAVNMPYLGEYLVWLESETNRKAIENDKRWKQLMDEVVRVASVCNKLEKQLEAKRAYTKLHKEDSPVESKK